MAASLESLEAGDHIAHMIDVLKPFLVKHVKCLHLLAFLPFMRAHAGKILKLERNGNLEGASELFLECLHEADEEPGRYAAFRDALREAEYDHIARVLDGEAVEENHLEHCKLIEIFTGSIIDKMDPIEMLRQLRHHSLLTESEESEIRNIHREHSRYDAALTLLDCVHRRKLGWYDKFMSTMLEMYPQLVELVDPHFKEKKERQGASKLEETVEVDTNSIQEPSLTENSLSRDESTEATDQSTLNRLDSKLSNQEAEIPKSNWSDDQSSGRRLGNISTNQQPGQSRSTSGRQTDESVSVCTTRNCIHCALLNDRCRDLQGQIFEMQSELSELKKLFSKFLQAQLSATRNTDE